jgi:HD-GYP domain-containing protein (c-di-GMP phosphodiesterase class II)
MRLIATSRAPDGAELGRDVLVGRPDGAPLLRSGVILTDRYRELLMRAGVRAIYVEDLASAGIVVEPMVDDVTREVATRAVSSAYLSARDSLIKGKSLAPGVVDSLQDVVDRLIRHVDTSEGVALALADLSSADAYTYQHSIDVAALGILIGQRYFRQHGWIDYRGERNFTRIDERLSSLGLGLLLHDIGKLSIPSSILDKPGQLTPEEWKIMQTHPRAGVDLLESGNWSPLVKAVVLRHHERWDGSGYPGGEVGEEIHQMARIAAVADVYDAITSDRRYAPARPAHEGVRAIAQGSGALFDPDVVDAFKGLVAPYPPGSPIELTDNRRGVVVSVDEHTLDRPVVRVLEGDGAPYEVSLLLDSSIRIAGWDDEQVADEAPQPLTPAL